MTTERVVQSVSFDEGGVTVQYADLKDVRVEGQVALQHLARIEVSHPDYAEDIEDLQRRALRLLKNALEDWQDSPAWTPEVDDDDQDEGMGES